MIEQRDLQRHSKAFAREFANGLMPQCTKRKFEKRNLMINFEVAHGAGQMTFCEHFLIGHEKNPYTSVDEFIAEIREIYKEVTTSMKPHIAKGYNFINKEYLP